jgi:hypothetical protein
MIFKIILTLFAVFILYRSYEICVEYLKYKKLKAAGVVFPSGFSLTADVVTLGEILKKHPTGFPIPEWIHNAL